MTTPLPARVVAGLALAVAGALPTQAAAAPIADSGTPTLPAFSGAPAIANEIANPTNPPQNPFMAREPELEHPQRHLDDRRLSAERAARATRSSRARSRCRRRCAARSPSTSRAHRHRLPLAARAADGEDHRPADAADHRRVHAARRARTRPTRPSIRTSPVAATSSSTKRTGCGSRPRPTTSTSSARRPPATGFVLKRDYDLTAGARRRDRAHHLRPARLQPPDLVRLQGQRQGRHARSQDRRAEGEEARRGDPELVRDRRGRRLHRLRQAHVSVQGKRQRQAADRVEEALSELGDRQAEPGQRRLRHDADAHGLRLRRDHRQRRPDEHRRLPHASESSSAARSARSANSRCSASAAAPPRTR